MDGSLVRKKELQIQKFPDTRRCVHTYPDSFKSATFSFRIRLPSTRNRQIRPRIWMFFDPLSRMETNISATNPDIFESDNITQVLISKHFKNTQESVFLSNLFSYVFGSVAKQGLACLIYALNRGSKDHHSFKRRGES